MQSRWEILRPDSMLVDRIQRRLDCHPLIATVLANRRIGSADQAHQFIHPSMNGLPSPMLLSGMAQAVERICRALQHQEKILVIGDYDADGVTATAVLVTFLQHAGAQVACHLPHRQSEGYGFHPEHVAQLAAPKNIGLIITVDCGTSSHAAVSCAARFGIDVIVTDHHAIGRTLPDAYALINPKLPGQPEELADLAGVGVAFYLTIALRTALRDMCWWNHRPEPNLKRMCDLVALGTVADLVPLTGINRILIKAGLEQMNNTSRPGIRSLLAASGIRQASVSSEDIAFRLAPRINAAGRMAHARSAYQLLCTGNMAAAQELAETLNSLNTRRQAVEGQIYKEIIRCMESRPDLLERRTLLMAGADWHEGVLGIVAAKLAAHFYRPVILLNVQGDTAKGSGRSIPEIDLFRTLTHCSDLLDQYGGHQKAAGLTVKSTHIEKLRAAFDAAVTEIAAPEVMMPKVVIDSEIDFEQITPRLLDEMAYLEPFGTDNPVPIFMARDVRVTCASIVGQRHRRMVLCQPNQSRPPLTAIQFNLPPETPRCNYFDQLAFRLQWNRYRSKKEIQIVVEAY